MARCGNYEGRPICKQIGLSIMSYELWVRMEPQNCPALAASPGCGGWEKENFDLDGRAVITPMTIGYFKRTMRSIEEIEVARRRRR